jgi:hypothetical protein
MYYIAIKVNIAMVLLCLKDTRTLNFLGISMSVISGLDAENDMIVRNTED